MTIGRKSERFIPRDPITKGKVPEESVRVASYVGFVRIDPETKISKVLLLWHEQKDGKPAHWGLPGGGQERRKGIGISVTPPRLSIASDSSASQTRRYLIVEPPHMAVTRRPLEKSHRTAIRETGEEMQGIKPRMRPRRSLALVFYGKDPRTNDGYQISYVFGARRYRGDLDKHIQTGACRWFSIDEAVDEMAAGRILTGDVIIGMKAVMEWDIIQREKLASRRGKRLWEIDDRFDVYTPRDN